MPGTVNALVVAYYQSDEWQSGLLEETRKTRRRIIEAFRAKHRDKRVSLLRQDHIAKMLAEIRKPSIRRQWLKTIRGLLRFAIPTMLTNDPTEGMKVKLPRTKGRHSWSDSEIDQYRAYWQLGTQQRLVFEFALETMSRLGEVVRLGPQHIKHGRIRIERTHGSEDVDIPLSAELAEAIDAMPKTQHLTFLVTAAGKPRAKHGLGTDFAKWATAAGLPKRCRLHGLKKAGMRRLAEAGGTAHELMGISGHKTLAMVQHYTRGADRKRLADSGMAKMKRGSD